MSSTTRTKAEARQSKDFYETSHRVALVGANVARALAPAVDWDYPIAFDPCAGRGALLAACKEVGFETSGIEIDKGRADAANVLCGNALSPKALWPMDAGVVIMNPPFSKALEFLERAFGWAGEDRHVVALLRLGYVSPLCRHALFKGRSVDLHHLAPRPSFTGGGTDSAEYGWFAFGPRVTDSYRLAFWRGSEEKATKAKAKRRAA